MSPLGFDAKEMYQFISERFIGTNVEVQRQALQWLQLLCLLNIQIPMEILFDMFTEGIKTLHKGPLAIGKISLLCRLGVSPSLVSRYCEGYSFWST